MLNLQIPEADFAVVWNSLLERPAKEVFMVLSRLRAQVETQENANAQAAFEAEIQKRMPKPEVDPA